MADYTEAFVAFDVAKLKHAVAVADSGRSGEVRFLGEIENRPAAIERTIKKLGKKYDRLHVCFEAGPTGYGLYRQGRDLGPDCMGGSPGLIPSARARGARRTRGGGGPGAGRPWGGGGGGGRGRGSRPRA